MCFDIVAFGIYMGHRTDEENIAKLLFEKIEIDGNEYLPNDYDNIVEKDGLNFKFYLYKDIRTEKEVFKHGFYGEDEGKLSINENIISLNLKSNSNIKKIIQMDWFEPLDLGFDFENEIEFSIGYPHACAYMIYCDAVQQWNYHKAFIPKIKIDQLYSLRDRLVQENRLKENNVIGMISNCCL